MSSSRPQRASRALLACHLWLLVAGIALAQSDAPPKTADELLSRAATPAWTGIEGFEALGTFAAGGREMSFHLWRSRDGRSRLELGHRGRTRVFVVTSESGWTRVAPDPPVSLDRHEAAERGAWIDVFARFPEFYRSYPRRELEGRVDQEGATARVVRLFPRAGYPVLYHVEESSGRILGGLRQYFEEDSVSEARLYYRDYREVAPGVSFAFTVEADEGTYYETLDLERVVLSKEPLPDELFVLGE